MKVTTLTREVNEWGCLHSSPGPSFAVSIVSLWFKASPDFG